jgi:hypothetical protein
VRVLFQLQPQYLPSNGQWSCHSSPLATEQCHIEKHQQHKIKTLKDLLKWFITPHIEIETMQLSQNCNHETDIGE